MNWSTLLSCRKASERFFNLVCNREVWPEIVKEAACRIPYTENPKLTAKNYEEGGAPSCLKMHGVQLRGPNKILQELQRRLKNRVKVTVTVEGGWGNPETFDVDGKRLEELTTLAKLVEVALTLVEVEEFTPFAENTDVWRVVVGHMEQQQMGKLEKVKLDVVNATKSPLAPQIETGLFFSLLKLSKRWEIKMLFLPFHFDNSWTSLSTNSGHISKLVASARPRQQAMETGSWNTLRKLWETSDEMMGFQSDTGAMREFKGGRTINLDLEAEWQHILEVI